MPETLTIAAAARLCHCDRRTLQRAIHADRLHLDADHCLSREELMATGYLIVETPQETPQDMPHGTPLEAPQVTPHTTPQDAPRLMPQETPQATALLSLVERLTTAVEGIWQELRQLREHQQRTPHATPQKAPQGRRHRAAVTPHVTSLAAPQDTPHGTPQPSLSAMT